MRYFKTSNTVKSIFILAVDALIVYVAFFAGYFIRANFKMPAQQYMDVFDRWALLWVGIYIFFFMVFRIHKQLWRYTSIEDIVRIVIASLLGMVVSFAVAMFITHFLPHHIYPSVTARPPRSVALFACAMVILVQCGARLIYMKLIRRFAKEEKKPGDTTTNLLIVGAGDAAAALIVELQNHTSANYMILGIVDDDPKKHGHRVHGIKVLGEVDRIEELVDTYHIDEIIVAIPSATFEERSAILAKCPHQKCKLRMMRSIYNMEEERPLYNAVNDINIEDLLGREPIELTGTIDYLKGKKVMVTGGGGSIGSELCRQIMQCEPEKLYILDLCENTPYELVTELTTQHGCVDNIVEIIIGSVQDEAFILDILQQRRPDIIFHAAAYKHVPLMEDYPKQAIKNNIFGTYCMAKCAHETQVDKFVMVSTDKAVNPTNVMGATKRIAELIVQAFDKKGDTNYVAVRFGNVLGSAGSVVPLFKAQILAGGPVTVTHKDITRYFMTIPEASSLVLQAGNIAAGGEIFVLDMGSPVKIFDIAMNMIYLAGMVPYQDIDIVEIGLRPGEKLYEELLLAEEGIEKTQRDKIFVAQPSSVTMTDINRYLRMLKNGLENNLDMRQVLQQILPTYHPALNGKEEYFEGADVSLVENI